jgi:putative phosphoserine phosphatase / 1-acylglycerol-3-phosphate O-acyltransferase
MARTAAIFDLDRTLVTGSPDPAFRRHLVALGLPVDGAAALVDPVWRAVEEASFVEPPATVAQRPRPGWPVEGVRSAATAAAAELEIPSFVEPLLGEHRAAGRLPVLVSSAGEPVARAVAERLGIAHVVATPWAEEDGHYTGAAPPLRGPAKRDALRAWAASHDVDLGHSWAYADRYADAVVLDAVGHPVAVNPDPALAAVAGLRGWPVRHLDVSEGVPKVLGRELQGWIRPVARPELLPNARVVFDGVEHVPSTGPAILAFNHRSYFDPTVLGLLAARVGRPVRGLGKKEVFDAPLIGRLARWAGGIRVERASGSDEPLERAAAALAGGELVMIAPQGTIPRGLAFFDPQLRGRWGAARLAAMSGAPVIPIGLWGTEKVWPRSTRLPRLDPRHRPLVTVRVGPPVALDGADPAADTEAIMAAISALLPDEARQRREPTDDELRATLPPGYTGDPRAELDRRPGTDT